MIADTEPLIAKSGGDAVRSKQRGQKVALRIAITRAGRQNFRSRAGDRVALVVGTVLDVIADPFERALRDLQRGWERLLPIPWLLTAPMDAANRLRR